jgi:hypothetical protein
VDPQHISTALDCPWPAISPEAVSLRSQALRLLVLRFDLVVELLDLPGVVATQFVQRFANDEHNLDDSHRSLNLS